MNLTKTTSPFLYPALFSPHPIIANAKLGLVLHEGENQNGGTKEITITLLQYYRLDNSCLYGFNNVVKPRDWVVLVFLNETGCVCTTVFHSASQGAFFRYISRLLFDGVLQPHQVVTKMAFSKEPKIVGNGSCYVLEFSKVGEHTTDFIALLDDWGNTAAADNITNAEAIMPAKHLKTFAEHNTPAAVKRIAATLGLTQQQKEALETIDTTTGEVTSFE